MNIKFKQTNDTSIAILDADTDNQIGCIFTPSGTGRETPSAIQVCGFDRAFDLWGCGVFNDNKGNHKQDIQLLFNKNSCTGGFDKFSLENGCMKCFNYKHEGECKDLRIFSKKELIVEALEKTQ